MAFAAVEKPLKSKFKIGSLADSPLTGFKTTPIALIATRTTLLKVKVVPVKLSLPEDKICGFFHDEKGECEA